MKELKKLPDSELEIMLIIWQAGNPVSSAYIQERLKEKKKWTAPTVLGFLTRLQEKGFVSIDRDGRNNIYTPLIRKKDYLENESKTFFDKLCGKSLKTFVTSLYNCQAIDDKDLIELKKFINETAKEE
jgi:predicted transcriptional regulator